MEDYSALRLGNIAIFFGQARTSRSVERCLKRMKCFEKTMDELDIKVRSGLGNSTVRMLEEKIAQLEGAEDALSCSSGMGAIWLTISTLSNAGDHIIISYTITRMQNNWQCG